MADQAGKGSKPRNNHSPAFRNNYDEIEWGGAQCHKNAGRKQVAPTKNDDASKRIKRKSNC